MNISEPFLVRPVATTLLTVALALAGGIAFTGLPVSPMPQVDFPTIAVNAGLPGASPETMAASVATPLERRLGQIAGVTELTSSSTLGSTNITIQFDLNRNIDAAARDVMAALNAARADLPANLPGNPTYRKVNPSDAPVLILALTSKTLGKGRLYDAASTILAQKISQVDGVGQVSVGGSSLPAVRVELNPTSLNKYAIGLEDVKTALSNANANVPKGSLDDGNRSVALEASDQLFHAADYVPLVVAYRNGRAVRVGDVGDVVESVENVRNIGYFGSEPAVLLIVSRQPNANIIDTVDRVQALLPQLKAAIPSAIVLSTVMDRTTTIRASIHDVERTLVISVFLVIGVVFVFLRDWRATLIPGVAVPVSLIATFAAMKLLGYSLNNLSLMALTISTGFVVDDAIVVVENVKRHIEKGLAPMEAARLGSREIGFTVLSMSLSLIAVFIPLLLMGGIVGRLFREFAVTLSVAVLVSLLVSLTTTPTMCARLLRPEREERRGRLFLWSERMFERTIQGYDRTLTTVLDHPAITLLVLAGTVALNVYLFSAVPKGFFPEQDVGRLSGFMMADQASSFQAQQVRLQKMMETIRTDPAVDTLVGFTSGGSGGASFVTLKPLEERKASAEQIIARLRPKLAQISGAMFFLQPQQDIRIGGRAGNAMYQYTLVADDLDSVTTWAPRLLDALKAIPDLVDVNSDQQNKGRQVLVTYDRDTAARFGISSKLLDATLNDAFGQSQVSTMYASLNQYHVVMEVAPKYWQDPETLRDIYIKAPDGGALVPLGAVAKYEVSTAPLNVNHQGQFPAVTLSFSLPEGKALGDAVTLIEQAKEKIHFPAAIRASFQGTAKAFQDSLKSEPWLILCALATIYIVLGILYENTIHPLTILSTLPSAGVGAVLALLLTGTDLSIIAMIGVILLIGIVKKNAIMMIDFALVAEREGGKSPREAIHEACLLRFRPILMTTMAAILGACPLAFGNGIGSELHRPLGVAIIGGLVLSQMLTLYTTPVVYLALDRMRLSWHRRRGRSGVEQPLPSLTPNPETT